MHKSRREPKVTVGEEDKISITSTLVTSKATIMEAGTVDGEAITITTVVGETTSITTTLVVGETTTITITMVDGAMMMGGVTITITTIMAGGEIKVETKEAIREAVYGETHSTECSGSTNSKNIKVTSLPSKSMTLPSLFKIKSFS